MQHIIGRMEGLLGTEAVCFDFVLCVGERHWLPAGDSDCCLCTGHFLTKDENIFTYFEGKNMCPQARLERSSSYVHIPNESSDHEDIRQMSSSVGSNGLKRTCFSPPPDVWEYNMPPVVHPKYLFTCTVGRVESIARSAQLLSRPH